MLITGADQPEFNGQFTITIPDAKNFTYTIPGSSLLAETATGQIQAWEKLDSIYRGAEDSISITIPKYGTINHHWGTESQPPDEYLKVSGTNHPPYHGTHYTAFEKFFLGLNQTNVQNIEGVFSRTPTAAWLNDSSEANINDEANMAVFFYETLTHPRVGLGLTQDDFGVAGLAATATRLKAEGLGISPIISSEDTAQTIVQKLCETVDALPVLDANGRLSLQLVRPPADYGALITIGDADLADIPKPKGADWSGVFHETRIVFLNKDAAWTNDFVEWKDYASAMLSQSSVQPQTLQREWITDRAVALKLVKAAGVAAALPAQTGTLSVLFTAAKWAALAPGSLFKLNYSLRPSACGVFRVTKRSWNDSAMPVFEIEYTIDRSYLNADL
jgi:hypothetical protein